MNLLILDEPTNHLDINSREALENALLSFDGTIIAVTHDRYFLSKLANRILNFENCRITDFIGTYEQFCSYKKNAEAEKNNEKRENVVTSSKESYLQNKKEQAEIRKQERKIRLAKEEVQKIEGELENLEKDIEENASDYVKTAELWQRREELEERLLELYELLDI